jgi:DNA-binding response OmpR family regulator
MGSHLLLIEDEVAICDFLAENLRHDEHRVTTVGSLGEAAMQLRRFRPDALLLDVGLPDGSASSSAAASATAGTATRTSGSSS